MFARGSKWKPALRITAKRFKSLQATEWNARHVSPLYHSFPFSTVYYQPVHFLWPRIGHLELGSLTYAFGRFLISSKVCPIVRKVCPSVPGSEPAIGLGLLQT